MSSTAIVFSFSDLPLMQALAVNVLACKSRLSSPCEAALAVSSPRPRSTHVGGWLRRMRKLNYRVVFPFELKLRNTSDDCKGADDFYDLFAVVVHVGQGPNHGGSSIPAYPQLPLDV